MKILVMKDKGGGGDETRAGHRFETIVILTDCLTDYRFFFSDPIWLKFKYLAIWDFFSGRFNTLDFLEKS